MECNKSRKVQYTTTVRVHTVRVTGSARKHSIVRHALNLAELNRILSIEFKMRAHCAGRENNGQHSPSAARSWQTLLKFMYSIIVLYCTRARMSSYVSVQYPLSTGGVWPDSTF